MGYVSVEVPEGIFDTEIPVLCGFDEQSDRFCDGVKPASSQSDVEGRLSLDDRSFKLQSAVYQSDGKESVVVLTVAFACLHIDDRRHPSAIPGRETALVEIDRFHDIRIER